MDYQVALDPELGVSPQEFTQAWNETPACREAAHAGLASLTRDAYDPGLLAPGLIDRVAARLGMKPEDLAGRFEKTA